MLYRKQAIIRLYATLSHVKETLVGQRQLEKFLEEILDNEFIKL